MPGSGKQVRLKRPRKDSPCDENERFDGTLARLGKADAMCHFVLPKWVEELINLVDTKVEVKGKEGDFTDVEKEQIAAILDVVQEHAVIYDRKKCGKESPSHYSYAWCMSDFWGSAYGRRRMASFLRRLLNLESVDPNNNFLVCAGAMLLYVSCVIGDFGEHLRKNYHIISYKSLFVTNENPERKQYTYESGDDIDGIWKWSQGEATKSDRTLLVSGEVGSGKTAAVLKHATFERDQIYGLKDEDTNYVRVHLTFDERHNAHWNTDLEHIHRYAVSILEQQWRSAGGNCSTTYKSAAFLESCIQSCTEIQRRPLERFRSALGHDLLCYLVQQSSNFLSKLTTKPLFEQVLFILDDVGSCPWLYRAVGGVTTDKDHISHRFTGDTSFGKSYRFICVCAAGESVLSDMLNAPDSFYFITMKPSSFIFKEAMTWGVYAKKSKAYGCLLENIFFSQLIQNRRCATVLLQEMLGIVDLVLPLNWEAKTMGLCGADEDNGAILTSSDKKNVHTISGILVGIVCDKYKAESRTEHLGPEAVRETVAKGIRAFLCCREDQAEKVFSGFPYSPLDLGLFDTTLSWAKDGTRRVTISVSAAQQVMAMAAYGGRLSFITGIRSCFFESFSACLFTLHLDGYSTRCIAGENNHRIKILSDTKLSTFARSVSATNITGSYEALLQHTSAGNVLFAARSWEEDDLMYFFESTLQRVLCLRSQEAFVTVNDPSFPYAEVIAKSGDILFVIRCKENVDTKTANAGDELNTMGFSNDCDASMDHFVEALDLRGGDVSERLGGFMAKHTEKKGKSPEAWSTLHGKLLTRLLIKASGCSVAVPVLMCGEPRSAERKTEWVKSVQSCPVQCFGWNDPAFLLFVGGSIERSF
ncbi:hypothetical protein, conserved [Angomonas deanei]|uniref:Uncharacterized protein n=1 Tax=Angomonas deanei TaxID=59799 RepID=A0A7G2CBW6_9TRYP|nr:hypothetical protein, conserved [Angomonas deanei]